MGLITYLQFNGQCEAAFRLYETCLRGKVTMIMRHAEAAQTEKPQAAGWENKIYHVTLVVGDSMLQGADLPAESYEKTRASL